jgi:hypothetical protein
MWLSKRSAGRRGSSTDVGQISVESDSPAVVTDSEWRNAQVFGPGGYSWMPAAGQSVLVLKDGDSGGVPCVVAQPVASPTTLAAGEVCVGTAAAYGHFQNSGQVQLKGAEVRADSDGAVVLTGSRIDLNGAVFVNGVSLEVLLSAK